MEKIEPVAAYVRVSHTEQKLHGLSLDAQKMKLKEYAKNNNMKIVDWYCDEGVSARKLIKNRPELQRMIHDAQAGKFERIIFIKLDRFFRSVAEYHECMKLIAPVVWSTTEEEYDLTTANGRMLVNMKIVIAELEADQTGERIMLVNDYKVATGQPLSGSQPFGWMIAPNPETGRKMIVKDPEVSAILEDTLNHYLTYQSKRQAIAYMHSKHHISIGYDSFGKLLKNTMLYGAYRDNPQYCEAYMTEEEFNKLQDILKRNCKENTSDNRTYIFAGLLKCPECGRLLAGGVASSKNAYGTVYKYKKYRCPQNHITKVCGFKKAVSESVIEKMMLKNIGQYLEDAKIRAVNITDSGESVVSKYDIDELHAELERLNYSWRKGRIKGGAEQYDREYDELMEKIELAKQEQHQTTFKDFENIESVLHSGWQEIYNALDEDNRKAFWRSIVSSIELEWTTDSKRIARVNFY